MLSAKWRPFCPGGDELNDVNISHAVKWSWRISVKSIDHHQLQQSVNHLNAKVPSYQRKGSCYQDKTVSHLFSFYNGNIHTWKDGLYIEMWPK